MFLLLSMEYEIFNVYFIYRYKIFITFMSHSFITNTLIPLNCRHVGPGYREINNLLAFMEVYFVKRVFLSIWNKVRKRRDLYLLDFRQCYLRNQSDIDSTLYLFYLTIFNWSLLPSVYLWRIQLSWSYGRRRELNKDFPYTTKAWWCKVKSTNGYNKI